MGNNTFLDIGNGASLLLFNDAVCVVDTEIINELQDYTWHVFKDSKTTRIIGRKAGDKKSLYYIHRVIMSAPKGKVIDHINHDPLDNRRANLRICSSAYNNQNRTKQTGTSSKYKGVSLHRATNRWGAKIDFNKKRINLGLFDEEKEAALAYNNAALKYYGELALINTIIP